MQYRDSTSVHLPERNDAEILTSSERGNAVIDRLVIAVAKKQVSLLLAVVKQVNVLQGMKLQISVWKIQMDIN